MSIQNFDHEILKDKESIRVKIVELDKVKLTDEPRNLLNRFIVAVKNNQGLMYEQRKLIKLSNDLSKRRTKEIDVVIQMVDELNDIYNRIITRTINKLKNKIYSTQSIIKNLSDNLKTRLNDLTDAIEELKDLEAAADTVKSPEQKKE